VRAKAPIQPGIAVCQNLWQLTYQRTGRIGRCFFAAKLALAGFRKS
jgi:hypothetical protein